MKDITKKYTNGEVTIVWQPVMCIHSEMCFHGLPEVFNPNEKPWINATGSTTKQIVDQVNKCPSGALSYFMNSEKPADNPEQKDNQ
ncbi:(4Fe-4S)-binding protein [Chitinophaga sp. MM2321]|uniref:(4Fe-4S)-binding protein n=1 Tax=Chitinophaga sp. MM2321 TaxID=3137178 RepID=UPI0032D574D0